MTNKIGQCARLTIGWTLLLSYYLPREIIDQTIDASKSHKDRKQLKKLSSESFNKFNSIVKCDEIPLDLSLQIWELIINQVLDLPVILKLIGHDSRLDTIISSLKLSIKVLPFYAFRISGTYKLILLLFFERYPKAFIEKYLAKKLFKFMEKTGMKFTKCTVCATVPDLPCVGAAVPDYIEFLDLLLFNLSSEINLEADTGIIIYNPPIIVLNQLPITNLRFGLSYLTPDFIFSQTLKSVTLTMDNLLTESTLAKVSNIHHDLLNLKRLKLEYSLLCTEYNSSSNFKELSSRFADLFKRRPEVDIKIARLDHNLIYQLMKTERNSYFDLLEDLSPIYKYFESIGLPFDERVAQYLNKLGVSKLILEDTTFNKTGSGLLNFDDIKLKELNLYGISLKVPVVVNLKKLTKLHCLTMVNCSFDGEVFSTFPNSFHKIHLEKCEALGVLKMPKSLRVLKLNGSYPKLFIDERRQMTPGIILEVVLHESNDSETRSLTEIIEQISTVTKEIYFTAVQCRPYFAILSKNPKNGPPVSPSTRNREHLAQFSLQFSETVRKYKNYRYFEKLCYLDIFRHSTDRMVDNNQNEESAIFTQISNCCMKAFQFGKHDQTGFWRISGENTEFQRGQEDESYEVMLHKTFEESKLPYITEIHVAESKKLLPSVPVLSTS
ncbi:unnamed protein product [Ambrosiozyma monospora]|uniref:Unnamed protein product n=1 Tax=Ambrosiozyma monospora TaxID=43982 RepID=A0ACB5T344_AMBMO|nr:unnamed protein product [Ambrosiozyma monospora]